MAILVTGGAGYIGSHLVHELIDAGENVVVLDNLSTGFAYAIPRGAPLIVGDCGDLAQLSRVIVDHEVNAIVHLAGSIAVSESLQIPLHYYLNNTANTRTVIEAAVKHEIRHFVFSSTAAVYGHPTEMRVTEDAPTRPLSAYGRSKLMSELILKDAGAAHGLRFAILRFFNAAGADPKLRTGQSTFAAGNLIKRAVQTAIGLRPKIEIYGTDYPTPDGSCVRDYIHVMDLVQALGHALGYLRREGESTTLNVGYGHGASVLEVIDAVQRISSVKLRVEKMERRNGEAAAVIASSENVRNVLGWRPRFDSLDLIVGTALAWEKVLTSRHDDGSKPMADVA